MGHWGSAAWLRASKCDVMREVWESVGVLSIMYGVEEMTWNESEIEKLEAQQNREVSGH